MMTDLHHPLITELPEYREDIHRLKTEDHHFRRLFDRYHEVDKEVVRIEQEVEAASDVRLEDLKIRRLHLKDDLHVILKQKR
jgi:uncharacterized protein YdcH (DUF465 family)